MKKGLFITVIAFAATAMFSAFALADGGCGRGYHHRGDGYQMGDSENCPGYGKSGKGRYGKGAPGWGALSEEDAAKVENERKAFFEDTKDLRQSIHQKRLEMRAEMAKQNPDAAKLSGLQKEISDLKADFDQKRLNHRLEMKKLLPDNYQAGAGMGRGRGHGRGPGSGSGGDCWRQ